MTTEKQKKSNQENALLSTGPITENGKVIVSKNAVKHGIFTNDLVIEKGDGKEKKEEYLELLSNLIDCLNPNGQLENLLVEKIAVDFWRLRRVLRFEMASIRKYLDGATDDFYSQTNYGEQKLHKTKDELDKDKNNYLRYIRWNERYIACLNKGIVKFDEEIWTGEGIESNIEDNFYMIIGDDDNNNLLSKEEFEKYENGELGFEELKNAFKRAGYDDKKISKKLIEGLIKQNEGYRNSILKNEKEKKRNKIQEEVNIKMKSLPSDESSEKIMKYEKAIQKSIYQNLAVLKKLQSIS